MLCDPGVTFRNKIVEGKAAFVLRASGLDWFGGRFEHPSVNFEGEANVAAFRLEGKNYNFRGVYIRDYQMGVLGGTIYNWKLKRTQTDRGYVRFYNCTIEDIGKVSLDNMAWQNLSHGIYIASFEELHVENCYFGPVWLWGHLLKSRCRNTYIINSGFHMGQGQASLAIGIENGGNCTILGVDIVQGEHCDNADVIGYAKEYWGDVPGDDIDSEYYGLYDPLDKLWPGDYKMTLTGVNFTTELLEIPHSQGRVGLVKGPALPSLGLELKNCTMVSDNNLRLEWTMDRGFIDFGGNVK